MSHVSSHSTATANSPDGLSALHKKFGHANLGIYVVIFLALALCPLFLNNYWLLALNNIGLYAVLALSLNIVLGNTGLFNMGHMAFYAIGAYTTAILNTQFQVPVLWLMPISGLFAGIAALFVAWPVIRLRGDYLLIVTIAVVEIVCIALENDIFGITGGSNGIFGIDRPMLFGIKIFREWQFFYLIWGFLGWHGRNFIRRQNEHGFPRVIYLWRIGHAFCHCYSWRRRQYSRRAFGHLCAYWAANCV